MSVLNVNIKKLCSKETIRYNGPAENREHGTYTMILMPNWTKDELAETQVHVHMSLEALIQLEQRIAAAKQHMISH